MGASPVDDQAMFEPAQPAEVWKRTCLEAYTTNRGTVRPYRVVYYVPENPVGLVFVCHAGKGGVMRYITTIDVIDILNHLTEAGFAFAATDSSLRNRNPQMGEKARWDVSPTTDDHVNRDYGRLKRLRLWLIEHTDITTDTPLFALGTSNGGSFSYTLAHMTGTDPDVPRLRAIAIYNSRIHPIHPLAGLFRVPSFIVTGENDAPEDRLPNQKRIREELLAASVSCELHISQEKTLHPDRFNRIPQIADAPGNLERQIFDVFVHGHSDHHPRRPRLIGEDGARVFKKLRKANKALNAYNMSLFELLFPVVEPREIRQVINQIKGQMKVAWASHQTTSEFANQNVRFFLAQLPSTSNSRRVEP